MIRNTWMKEELYIKVTPMIDVMIFQADKRTRYGDAASVLSAVEKAGVSRLYIETNQESPEP
jgi:biopolymer transport protein ExbD